MHDLVHFNRALQIAVCGDLYILIGHDADQVFVIVQHRQMTYCVVFHDFAGADVIILRVNRDGVLAHAIADWHGILQVLGEGKGR